jgi:hypothetical protein
MIRHLAIIALLFASPAQAQNVPCFPYADIKEVLEGQGEVEQVRAVTEDNWVLEIFANEDGTAWSLVLIKSPKVACLVDVGTAWEVLVQKPSY